MSTGYKKLEEQFDYVVIATGYEERLLQANILTEFMKDVGSNNVKLIFIYDSTWSKRMYKMDPEADHLFQCAKNAGLTKHTIACFKCSPADVYKLRSAVESNIYCAAFAVENEAIYTSNLENEPSLKFIEWDAESG